MADEGTISHAAGDVIGLGLFAIAAGVILNGARKVTKKIVKKDKNNIEWF